jgi:diguanylate cyclase (GGDEF)-like protein
VPSPSDPGDLLAAHPRQRFEQMLAARCESGECFALMLVDLDGFKGVSARYGANVADLLLYEISARLRDRLLNKGVVRRSGDNQFAVLVPGIAAGERAERLARALIERLERSITVSGIRFRLTATIGITLFPQHGKDWRHLLLSADTAAYDARTQGKGKISVSFPAVG